MDEPAAIAERAGGVVTDLDGTPWTPDSDGIVATNGQAHDEVVEILAEFDS